MRRGHSAISLFRPFQKDFRSIWRIFRKQDFFFLSKKSETTSSEKEFRFVSANRKILLTRNSKS
ncbi:hypothetical protein CH380_14550 [Leptospira adleri]|uniref:Uncharacterized protein n=1 Tax=Leptospira adleri TaxID=2023186 RepID=A0A2M9YLG5_9LEPT|nr:hypothetical protein CH380_14550 [Leptospira adleri]PJZ60153.1 hypothetical protein CH376_19950 [Leptospira adleri]